MRTITPTGFGKAGTEVPQLGSTRAVIERLPHGALLLVGRCGGGEAVDILRELGRAANDIIVMAVHAGPDQLYAFKPETVVGVGEGAFDGMISPMYAEFHRILSTRFKSVLWA